MAVQRNEAERQTSDHDRRRAAEAAGNERYARKTADRGEWRSGADRIQGSRVGGEAELIE